MLLPQPLPPMITSVSPRWTLNEMLVEHSAIAEFPDEMFYFNDCGVSGHARNDE